MNDRKKIMKFIIEKSEHLGEIDNTKLLCIMNNRGIKISGCSDGSRIWLDRLPVSELEGIKSYIEKILERDKHEFLTID